MRDLVRRFSPRHRRWRRLLSTLTIDPDDLPRPLPPPGERDFLICGSSRSGTTLLAAALYQPPLIVTVSEPWDAMRLPPAELFRSLRREIESTRQLRRGRLDVAALLSTGAVRWCRDGEQKVPVDVETDYVLGVKFPVLWRYLDLLPDTKFLVCVRDPRETISSYRAGANRLAQGLDYEIPFNRVMNESLQAATDDPALRRVLLYEYVSSRLLPHLGKPNVLVVRYERWFTDPHALIREIGDFLGVPVDAGRVTIRPPRQSGDIDPVEQRLIEDHCRSRAALGYPGNVTTPGG